MTLPRRVSLVVADEDDAASAALDARVFAREVGFRRIDAERVTTVVSELATNIVKYAGSGRIGLRAIERRGRIGLEVEARDRGPGIESIERALADHHSTSGSLGLGLPGVRRLMDEFEITSTVGVGTTVTAVQWLT